MASSSGSSSQDTQVSVSDRSHIRRCRVCWHCGRSGHIQRRCFRRWRQQRMHRSQVQRLAGSQSAVGTSTCIVIPSDWTLSHDWQLDSGAMRHTTPRREWFSTFSAMRHDEVHGVGDIRLQFASGSVLVLRDVQYVPDARRSFISISQLRDHGCHVSLTDESFTVLRGSLMIVRGGRGARLTLLHVLGVRDGIVSVSPLPYIRSQLRRVSFADEQRDSELVVQTEQESFDQTQLEQSPDMVTDMLHADLMQVQSTDRQEEQASSNDTLLEESSGVMTDMHVWSLRDDLLSISDALPAEQSGESVVQDTDMLDRELERSCSSETQQDVVVQDSMHGQLERSCSSESQQTCSSTLMMDSDCIGADSLVMQSHMLVQQGMSSTDEMTVMSDMAVTSDLPRSFMDMLMASDDELDADTSELDDTLDQTDLGAADLRSYASSYASAYRTLLDAMTAQRFDIAFASGIAFAVGVLSHCLVDTGTEHGGLQAIDRALRYALDVRLGSSRQSACVRGFTHATAGHSMTGLHTEWFAHWTEQMGIG